VSNNWRTVPLSEIADINPRLGKTALAERDLFSFVPMAAVGASSGMIDVSTKRAYADVKKGLTPFQSGDVLFAKITPCMENGKMAVVPKLENQYGFGSTEFHVIRPKAGIDAKYLYYFVSRQDYRKEAAHHMTGAVGQKRVPTDFLKQTVVPLPPTIEDQKKIVAEIEKQFSRLDEAVSALKRIQANLKRHKAAVLKAAVEGKLTEQWRRRGAACCAHDGTRHVPIETGAELLKRILAERRSKWEADELAKMKAKGSVGAQRAAPDSWKKKYKEPAGPDTTNLPELPEGWVWAKSDQLFSFVTSGSRGWANYYSETGPIFLRMGNLDHDTISLDLSDLQRVQPPEGSEGLRTRVSAGDILVSITADVGMVGIVPDGFEEAYINQHVSLARPLSAVNSTYLAWFLACKIGQDQFKELQRGATKVGLGLDDIKSVNIPLPPIAEQKAILAEIDRRLSVTEELEITIETNLKRAERLRQTILQQTFAGGLG
jgi:type I restriction enzyme, S subunit